MKISRSEHQVPHCGSCEFTLKWSTRRKTIGLMVTTAGDLVVAAPVGTPPQTIQQALETHHPWVMRKLAERREAMSRIEPGQAYYLGRAYPVRLVGNTLKTVRLTDGEMHLGRCGSTAKTWELLRDWYRQGAQRLLTDRVRHYARLM